MTNPESWRVPIFFGLLALMLVLETIKPKRPWQVRRTKRFLFHFGLSVLNTVVTRLFLLVPLFGLLHYISQKGWGVSNLLGLSGLVEIFVTVVLFDLYDYWWHRFNHTVPFLWRFHHVHHIDTHVDVTTALRFHPGELMLSYGAKALWILFWGPSAVAFLISEMSITFFSQIHHSNIDFRDGFEKVIRGLWITPRIHASHHTVSLRTRDANYGTIFSFWDRMFQTFRQPDYEEMKTLGLSTQRENDLSFWKMLTAPIYYSN